MGLVKKYKASKPIKKGLSKAFKSIKSKKIKGL